MLSALHYGGRCLPETRRVGPRQASTIMTTAVLSLLGTETVSIAHRTMAPTEYPNREAVLRKSKIMIVDDDRIEVRIAHRALNHEGFLNFVTTTESRDALALVNVEHPDVLLLDIMMPHLSGLEILA